MIDINNPLKGKMNGYAFSVKPKSLLARKVNKELQEELAEWQKKNNKEYTEYMKKHSEEVQAALDNNDYLAEVFKNSPDNKEWIEDVEFRAQRWKKMADYSMDFSKTPPNTIWKSEELEYGIIEMAWDFFTGKREVPMDMLLR